MGKYDTQIIPKKQKYERATFADAFKQSLGQGLGALPATAIGEGFKGLSDYIVGSGLATKRGEVEKGVMTHGQTIDLENKKADDTRTRWADLLKRQLEADEASSAGRALTPEVIEDANRESEPSPATPVPSPKIPIPSPAAKGKTFASPNLRGSGVIAAQVTDDMFPGVRRNITTVATNAGNASTRADQFGRAEQVEFGRAGADKAKTLDDFYREARAENPNLDPANVRDDLRLNELAMQKANADLAHRAWTSRPGSIEMLRAGGKSQSEVTKNLGEAAKDMMASPEKIATKAMDQTGKLDELSFRAMMRPRGNGSGNVQQAADALARGKEEQRILEQRRSDLAAKGQLSPGEADRLNSRLAAIAANNTRAQGVLDAAMGKNPNLFVKPDVSLGLSQGRAKADTDAANARKAAEMEATKHQETVRLNDAKIRHYDNMDLNAEQRAAIDMIKAASVKDVDPEEIAAKLDMFEARFAQ
jgi:hypothetical protein